MKYNNHNSANDKMITISHTIDPIPILIPILIYPEISTLTILTPTSITVINIIPKQNYNPISTALFILVGRMYICYYIVMILFYY
jgi:pilus assembly protein TadC